MVIGYILINDNISTNNIGADIILINGNWFNWENSIAKTTYSGDRIESTF